MVNVARIAVAALALCLAGPFSASAQSGGKKGKSSAAQKKGAPAAAPSQDAVGKERLDAAVRMFREEQYGPAAVAFYDLLLSPEGQAVKDAAQYNLAKSLYRLKLHQSALHHFTEILARGPQSTYYRSSLEWCLFIARKIVADDRVLAAVAKYNDGRFPDDYKNEFRYLLARFHYLKALAIETGAEMGALGETRTQETITGGLSVKGDLFSGDDEPAAEPEEDDPVVKKEGGGFSIEDDIFADEEPAPAKKDKKKKGKKGKKEEVAEAKPAEPTTPAKISGDGLTAKEHIEAANRMLVQIEGASSFGARAKFLQGVMHYRDKRDNDALEAFKSVVRMTKEPKTAEERSLRQLAFFQLARAHFGAKQPSFSIYYYDKIRRFTYEWLEAIYESSWAEFRLGNYEKSLGNLLTLHSPFFFDQYFPESHVLKAVVYYENCRYPEAKEILTEFMKRYEPVHEELKNLTARQQAPDKYYEILANLRSEDVAEGGSEKSKILSQILEIALSDQELEQLDGSYREVDAELKELDQVGPVFTQSKLHSHLTEVVGAVRTDFQRDAGRAVKRKLEFERDQIKNLIQQAIRIDIETARAEQERIESTLRDVQSRPKDEEKEFTEWTDDEKLVWPFKDEYWRDELGTYQLTLAHSCR